MKYWALDMEKIGRRYTVVAQKHYPHRIISREWKPDFKLIGKAIARGWAVPCRYYTPVRGRGKPFAAFVFPGISDEEYMCTQTIMGGENIA